MLRCAHGRRTSIGVSKFITKALDGSESAHEEQEDTDGQNREGISCGQKRVNFMTQWLQPMTKRGRPSLSIASRRAVLVLQQLANHDILITCHAWSNIRAKTRARPRLHKKGVASPVHHHKKSDVMFYHSPGQHNKSLVKENNDEDVQVIVQKQTHVLCVGCHDFRSERPGEQACLLNSGTSPFSVVAC